MPADMGYFPDGIALSIQQGTLYSEWIRGLTGIPAFSRETALEDVVAHKGQSITMVRHGRITPRPTPRTAASIRSNRDNGLTPETFAVEKFTMNFEEFMQTADIDIISNTVGLRGTADLKGYLMGDALYRTREWVARDAYFKAYAGGNSRVRTDIAASTTTTCCVDDARGFDTQVKASAGNPEGGTPEAVSSSNKLDVYEINPSTGAVVQTLHVTGCAFDTTDYTSDDNKSTCAAIAGISGVLTFDTATAPTNGNVLLAKNRAKMYRINGRYGLSQFTTSDTLANGGLRALLRVCAKLESNGVPPNNESGLYHVLMTPLAMADLAMDNDFQRATVGRIDSKEFRSGKLTEAFGCLFIPTNEMPEIPANADLGIPYPIGQALVAGAEAIVEGRWNGLDEYEANAGRDPQADVYRPDLDGRENALLITAPLNDRARSLWGITYYWPGAMVAPTDVTANKKVIPTADPDAQYKRAAVLQFVQQ